MGESIDRKEALRVLEAAATRAASIDELVDPVWEQRTRAVAEMRSNKVAIAAFGTALLAKAVNPKVDALSLHEDSGPDGYAARGLASDTLAANARRLKYALGTNGPDPLAASPWFGPKRISDITKWRRSAREPADQMIGWLSMLRAAEAEDALVAFLRVRMEAADQAVRRREAALGAATVSLRDLVAALESFVLIRPEDGRRGAAATAAAFSAAGYEVEARIVNDPGQTDVDVMDATGPVIGIEVKQKPATADDALDIAAGAAKLGASKALLCALDPTQERLDDATLRQRAEDEHRVALQTVYSVRELLELALFSNVVTRAQFLSTFPGEMARSLDELEASPEGQARWRAEVERWT